MSDTTPLENTSTNETDSVVISSIQLLAKSQERVQRRPPRYWWHFRLGTVVLLTGETSAGKTVFGHNLGYALATGKDFLGYKPPRPLRVLHVDFESYDEVYAQHLSAIGTTPGWDFLDLEKVIPGIEANPKAGSKFGKTFLAVLEAIILKCGYDVVIIDNIMEAYPVEEENSTKDANEQMLAFRTLARKTGAGIIGTHNSGQRTSRQARQKKANNKFLARGSTARVDRADFGVNFTEAGKTTRWLTLVKSRAGGLGEQLGLKFNGAFGYTRLRDDLPDTDTLLVEESVDALLGLLPATTTGLIKGLVELEFTEATAKRAVEEADNRGLIKKTNRKAPWQLVSGDSAHSAHSSHPSVCTDETNTSSQSGTPHSSHHSAHLEHETNHETNGGGAGKDGLTTTEFTWDWRSVPTGHETNAETNERGFGGC